MALAYSETSWAVPTYRLPIPVVSRAIVLLFLQPGHDLDFWRGSPHKWDPPFGSYDYTSEPESYTRIGCTGGLPDAKMKASFDLDANGGAYAARLAQAIRPPDGRC